jgi:hypothetical protein
MAVERAGFQIDFTADVSGLTKGTKEVSAGLEEVTGRTKDVNKSLEEGKGKLEEHGKGLEEGGRKAQLFGTKTGEVKEATRALSEAVGGLGIHAREMGSAFGLAAGLMAIGLEKIIEAVNETNAAEDELAKGAAEGVGEMLKQQGDKAGAAATAHDQLATALNKAATGERNLMVSMQNRIKEFNDYIAGLQKVQKAEDEAEEASVRRAVRNKEITSEEGQNRIDTIHGRAKKGEAAASDAEAANKLQEERNLLARAQHEGPEANAAALAAADKAREAADKAKIVAAYAGGEEVPGSAASRAKAAQKDLDKAQAESDEVKRFQSGATGGDGFFGAAGSVVKDFFHGILLALQSGIKPHDPAKDVAEEDAKVEEATKARDLAVKAVKEAAEEKARADKIAADAQKDADEAKKRAEDLAAIKKQYGGEEGQVARDAAELARSQAADAKAEVINDAAAAAAKAQSMLEGNPIPAPAPGEAAAQLKAASDMLAELIAALAAEKKAGVEDKTGSAELIERLLAQNPSLRTSEVKHFPPSASDHAKPNTPEPATQAAPGPAAQAQPKPPAQAAPGPADQAEPEPPAQAAPGPANQAQPEPSAQAAPSPADQAGPEPPAQTAPGPADKTQPRPTAQTAPSLAAQTQPEPTAQAAPSPADQTKPEAPAQAAPGPNDTATAMGKGQLALSKLLGDKPASPDAAADGQALAALLLELSETVLSEQSARVQVTSGLREEIDEIKRMLANLKMGRATSRDGR